VRFECPIFKCHFKEDSQYYPKIESFLLHLAVCHTVIVEENKQGQIVYNASSPDELALVNGARFFGYKFLARDDENNVVIETKGGELNFQLLNVIEFTSDRKRMTVIVRDPEGKIKVLCKGADSIILPRLKEGAMKVKETNQNLDDYANEGLRTLLIAEK